MATFGALSNILVRSLYDGRQLDKGLSQSQKHVQQFASAASIAGFRLASGFAASVGVAAGATFKLGKDFDLAFASIRKTVTASDKEFLRLKESLLGLAKTTGISANELADLGRIGGQLGVAAGDVAEFTEVIAKLNIAAAELSAEAAARGLSRLLALTGETVKEDLKDTASTLAFLGDKFATTEERILNFGVTLAGMARTAGLSSQEVLGISTAFSAVVEGTERASTATQKFITGLVQAVEEGGPKLEEFAKISALGGGVGTGEALAEQISGGNAGEAITNIITGLGKLKGAGESVFGTFKNIGITNVRMVQSFLAVSNAGDLARRAFDAATKPLERLEKLEKEFAVVQDTVAQRFNRLLEAGRAVFIRLFTAFQPQLVSLIELGIKLAGVVEDLAKSFGKLPDVVKSTVLASLAAVGAFAGLLIVIGGSISAWVALTSVIAKFRAFLLPMNSTIVTGGKVVEITRNALGQFQKTVTLTSKATGLFKTILASSVVQLGATVVAGLKLADVIDKSGDSLQGFEDHVEEAVSKVGIFSKTLEGFKIIGLGLWDSFKSNAAKAFEVIKSGFNFAIAGVGIPLIEQLGNFLDSHFGANSIARLTSWFSAMSKGFSVISMEVDDLQDILTKVFTNWFTDTEKLNEAEAKRAQQLFITAQSLGVVIKAGDSLADIQAKVAKALDKTVEKEEAMAKASEKAAIATFKLVGKLREEKKASAEAGEAAKFLGIKTDELTPKIQALALELIAIGDAGEKFFEDAQKRAKDIENLKDAFTEAKDKVVAFVKVLEDQRLLELHTAAEDYAIASKAAAEGTSEMQQAMESANNHIQDQIDLTTKEAEALEFAAKASDRVDTEFQKLGKQIRSMNAVFDAFGISTDNLIRLLGTGLVSAVGGLQGIFGKGGFINQMKQAGQIFGKGKGGFFKGLTGGKGFSGGGILELIGNIGSIAGPISAIAGPLFSIIGKIFKPKWKKISEEGARIFGKEFSEELSKTLEKDIKVFGSLQNAIGANLGDALTEVGVNADNLTQSMGQMSMALGMVENGTLDVGRATEQLGKAFPLLLEELQKLGTSGSFQIGQLVSRMEELGVVSQEVQDFIQQTAERAVGSLGVFLDFMAEKTELTSQEAADSLTVMAGAFAAALKASGSLLGAIQMMPESFGSLIGMLRETLGEEDKLLNQLTRYYNFISNNEEQLSALASLGDGFLALAEIGIINKNNVNDFANTFKSQFDEILAKTGDQTTALITMGPQIGILRDAFMSLGVEVPAWLQEMITKAEEAGASLAPPEGLPEILGQIRDILFDIASALGAVTQEAGKAGSAMKGIPNPPKPGGGGRPKGFASGGFVPETFPFGQLVRVGEPGTGGEDIIPRSQKTEGGNTGGGGTSIHLSIDARGSLMDANEAAERLAPAIEKVFEGDLRAIKTRFVDG